MKKQYVNPQCEYWCYVAGKLCSVGDALYGMARKVSGDAGHGGTTGGIIASGSNQN